jgi:hypothetical protein
MQLKCRTSGSFWEQLLGYLVVLVACGSQNPESTKPPGWTTGGFGAQGWNLSAQRPQSSSFMSFSPD